MTEQLKTIEDRLVAIEDFLFCLVRLECQFCASDTPFDVNSEMMHDIGLGTLAPCGAWKLRKAMKGAGRLARENHNGDENCP